jgi:hypothetical protein
VKLTDSRAQEYVEKHGDSSWEVDALPPPVLDLLVRTSINAYVDKAAMKAVIIEENLIKQKLKAASLSF